MNPHYIIDGYNLIYHIQQFRQALDHSLAQARDNLLLWIHDYQSNKQIKVTVVFDGDELGLVAGSYLSAHGLKVIYSKPPEKADPLIKRLIIQAKHKKSIILVSADSDLIQFSKHLGAEVLSPEDFYYRASRRPNQDQMDQKYNSYVDKDEINEWLKLFGENPE